MITQPATRALSAASGLVMAALAALQADRLGLVAAALAAAAVLASVVFRAAATLAVLLAVSAIALSDIPPVYAALSGLCAAGYLVLQHAVDATGLATVTAPTLVGAAGFTLVGLAATLFPLQLPWLPLVAPIAVFATLAVASRPFWTKPSSAGS